MSKKKPRKLSERSGKKSRVDTGKFWKELDRKRAESMARAPFIPVSNARLDRLDRQIHNLGGLSHVRFR